MPKLKWRSRKDGRHFISQQGNKSNLPKGDMKVIVKDEDTGHHKEMTEEEYTLDVLGEDYVIEEKPKKESPTEKFKRNIKGLSEKINREQLDMQKEWKEDHDGKVHHEA